VPLCEEAFAEAQIDDTDAKPGRKSRSGTHAREPREDHSGTRADCHVGEKGKRSTRGYCDVGKPGTRGTEKYFGGIARGGEAIYKQIGSNAVPYTEIEAHIGL
jgi:hypothetical protein